MDELYDSADDAGQLDRTAFVGTMEINLLRASGGEVDRDLRPALSALFDVIRSKTAIHAAAGVPPQCVRAAQAQ